MNGIEEVALNFAYDLYNVPYWVLYSLLSALICSKSIHSDWGICPEFGILFGILCGIC